MEKTMQYLIIKAIRDWCNSALVDNVRGYNQEFKQKLTELRNACTAILPHF
jgi:hypothetical protein